MTTETITAKFLGRIREAKRWVYSFEHNGKEQKFSCFEPTRKTDLAPPVLHEGMTYSIRVRHEPMKTDPSKSYHNLIDVLGVVGEEPKKPEPRPEQPLTGFDRAKFEIAKERHIVRESCLATAAEFSKTQKMSIEDVIKYAEKMEKWVLEAGQ